MKSLAILQRLAKQAVDQERQALLAIGGEIAEAEATIERLRQSIEREAAASPDIMTSGVTFHAFLKAEKARIRAFELRLEALRQAYQLQLERVRSQRVEEKRYERLAERRAEQAAREAAIKEQKLIDELVSINRKRR